MSDFPTDATETTFGSGRRAGLGSMSSLALDDVFDDPDHGEPGRDRMGVHIGYELFLFLAVGVLGFLVWNRHPELVRGQELRTLLVEIAALGLLTLGAGLSLRAAVPNLAVGPVAIAAALHFADKGDGGVVGTTGTAAAIALVVGVALAILVVGIHVPGWAASLAAAFVAIVYIQRHSGPVAVTGGYDPTDHAYYLVGGFVALAVLGGLFGSIKTVRRAVGRFRPVTDPARRRGGLAGALAAVALMVSTVLAAVGGVLIGANVSEVNPASSGLEWTGLALGAALLGGTSAFGRRGGIFGTVLTVVLVALFLRFEAAEKWRISWFAIAAAMVVAGLVVTRLVESLGRPQALGDDDDADDGWMSGGGTQSMTGWAQPRQDSWSSSLPAQPSAGRGSDLWSDGRWGSRSTS